MLRKMLQVVKSWSFATAAALGTVLAVVMASAAEAEGPTYSIKPVTESITTELAANVPVILAITGALIALTVAIRFLKKFVRA